MLKVVEAAGRVGRGEPSGLKPAAGYTDDEYTEGRAGGLSRSPFNFSPGAEGVVLFDLDDTEPSISEIDDGAPPLVNVILA